VESTLVEVLISKELSDVCIYKVVILVVGRKILGEFEGQRGGDA
jgi:hypothetical protein